MNPKYARNAGIVFAALAIVAFVLAAGGLAAQALNEGMSTNKFTGTTTCPVTSMQISYKVDAPPKTDFVKVTCDDSPWGFAWMSSSQKVSDGWAQPQEVLRSVKIGDAFVCARYEKVGWIGKTLYHHYRDCKLQS